MAPLLPVDLIHSRDCDPFCEKLFTLPAVIAYREEDGARYWWGYDFAGITGEM